MKRPMIVTVRGKRDEWVFPFNGDPALLPGWRADGLEVYELGASVPAWAAACGLARQIAAMHRAWQWLRCW